ncbi:MAG: hypothetical protein ACTHNU_10285 [Gaiellales bacterium]
MAHPRSQLQRAIRTDDAALALRAAADRPDVDLEDAFAICLLLRGDKRRYERACIRWLERFAAEVHRVSLADVQQVAHGFQAIRADPRRRDLTPVIAVLDLHRLHRAARCLERPPWRQASHQY